ncbi:MAG: hypothetical protein SF172_11350 [Burkholderiales bacterium]|nr:hypothetical protein [Burkholderiales bacterium]
MLAALAFICPAAALAVESEVANRNLGVNARQVERVKQAEAVRKGEAPVPEKSVRPAEAPKTASDIKMERIDVYASSIEELSGPEKPALQRFADRLEADRKLTPAQLTQMVLGFFLGGPPPEKEPPIEERTRDRVKSGGTMLANPRGTLQ